MYKGVIYDIRMRSPPPPLDQTRLLIFLLFHQRFFCRMNLSRVRSLWENSWRSFLPQISLPDSLNSFSAGLSVNDHVGISRPPKRRKLVLAGRQTRFWILIFSTRLATGGSWPECHSRAPSLISVETFPGVRRLSRVHAGGYTRAS